MIYIINIKCVIQYDIMIRSSAILDSLINIVLMSIGIFFSLNLKALADLTITRLLRQLNYLHTEGYTFLYLLHERLDAFKNENIYIYN